MVYSWNVITSKDIVHLRDTILDDFSDFLFSQADRVDKRKHSVISEDFYYVFIKDWQYRYNPDDYEDLCFKIATELYEKNIQYDYNLYELAEEYNKEKTSIMLYIYAIFLGKIKIDEEESDLND